LKAFVVDRAERLGVKPELIAMPALGVCAAAIDDRVVVQVRRHDQQWLESPRIWVAIIEEPGGKKTPAINAAVSPLRDIETIWRSEDASALQKYEIDLERHKVKLKKHCNDPDAGDTSYSLHPPAKPPMRRLVVTDATTESLARILAENPGGVLGVFDELAQLLGSFDAYRGGKVRAVIVRYGWSSTMGALARSIGPPAAISMFRTGAPRLLGVFSRTVCVSW